MDVRLWPHGVAGGDIECAQKHHRQADCHGADAKHWHHAWFWLRSLPREWEGRDVEIVGVVASLPTVNAQATRFEFDIERTLTETAKIPPHISLTWYVERPKKRRRGSTTAHHPAR